MTERVTVEQNGERFTLEVPDGTSDADIQSFLTQQTQPNQMLVAPPTGVENIGAGMLGVARPIAQAYYQGPSKAGVRDIVALAEIAKQVTPEVAAELAKRPIDVAKAYVQGHPWYGSIKSAPARALGFMGSAAGGVLTAPENAVMLPYNMAAYEQEQIRANPNAPEYATNPYAQFYRGEYPTQATAGAANQRAAVRNFATAGNPAPGTPEFQQMQQQYQTPTWIDSAMNTFRKYRTVIGQ
jgi:hypothetical protein